MAHPGSNHDGDGDPDADLFAGTGDDDPGADPRRARKKAMDYLARREYGRRELEHKLAAAGFRAQVAEAAVERLVADGLQDDRRFAESFVRSRVARGKGPLRIRADLRQRGVDAAAIDEVLAQPGADWASLARATREKRFGAGLPATFAERARQMRFLEQRGFGTDEIRAALGDDDIAK